MYAIAIIIVLILLLTYVLYLNNGKIELLPALIGGSIIFVIMSVNRTSRTSRTSRTPYRGGGKHPNTRIPSPKSTSILDFDVLEDTLTIPKDPKLKYPLYSMIVSLEDVKTAARDLPTALDKIITISREPYKLIAVNTSTKIVGSTLRLPDTGKHEPLRFLSEWSDTGKYDNIALFFTEPRLLQCTTGPYRSMAKNFQEFGSYLMEKLKETTPQPTLEQFRDYVFDNIKSCHNFRASLAARIYTYFRPNVQECSVLDLSAGWGDRLAAACALGIPYVGIDPNTDLQKPYAEIIKAFGDPKLQTVIPSGAEYLPNTMLADTAKRVGVNDGFSMIFTSTPYFDYELYSTGPQSVNAYTNNNFTRWLVDFLFYTLAKYAQFIQDEGYMILYIQDVGGDRYIEPIIMFITSWYDELHLVYDGIFSSNRFPAIVFRKTLKVTDSRQYNTREVFKETYHEIYRASARIWNAGLKAIPYEAIGSVHGNTVTDTSSLRRALYKTLMALPEHTQRIVWYGSKQAPPIVSQIHQYCKQLDLQFVYCVAKNELVPTSTGYTRAQLSPELQDVPIHELYNSNAAMDTIEFLQKEIIKRYSSNSDYILPQHLFKPSDIPYLVDAIRELLLVLQWDHGNQTISVEPSNAPYEEALRLIFPSANSNSKNKTVFHVNF
jgi:hypothetical protein